MSSAVQLRPSTSRMSPSSSTEDSCSASTSLWWPNALPVWQDNSKPGRSLFDYLEPKIHTILKHGDWRTILVTGLYKRDGTNLVSLSENRGRGFNWQRPTAEIINENTVRLNCFPTVNYVLHYASLVSTYFSLSPTVPTGVHPRVKFVIPKRHAAADLFDNTNLSDIGHADIVIIGYLDACPTELIVRTQAFLSARIRQEGQMFSWHEQKTAYGYTVAYLGCAAALWGDSVAYLTEALRDRCKTKCVLYVGRVGCLDPDLKPNETLAIGEECYVDGTAVSFRNILSTWASESSLVHTGSLITVPSPLCEDQQWFQRWKEQCSWVDCETAYIAQVAKESNMDFGYIHIASDNLGCQYTENLANEDKTSVQDKRVLLFEEIDKILEAFLDNYSLDSNLLARRSSTA